MIFTHSMCADCWDKRNADKRAPRDYVGTLGYCCWCGELNRDEIYFRHDPRDETLHCKGEHGPIASSPDVQAYLARERAA